MPRPLSFLSRAAALALSSLVVALGWFVLVAPLLNQWDETNAALEEVSALRQRLTQVVRLDPADPNADRNRVEVYRGDFLSGISDATIGAELQARLRAIVAANQSDLLSAQLLPSRKFGTLSGVGLRLHMRGSLDNLQRIVHAVETVQPLLFIERAVIRQDASAASGPPRAGLDAVRLFIEIDVAGVRWPQSAEAQK